MSQRNLSDWQRQVLVELNVILEAFPREVQLIGRYRIDRSGAMRLRLRLRVSGIPRYVGGMQLDDFEDFIVTVPKSSLAPPRIEVDHLRFLHHAHVLQGYRLCLYLDSSREWDPINGFGGFLDRLVDWLADAAGGRFDSRTALYHAVGGVLHAADSSPTIVVRDTIRPGKRAHHAWLLARTPYRFDLQLNRPADFEAEHIPIVVLDADLPFGAGTNLDMLLRSVDDPYRGRPAPDGMILRIPKESRASATIMTVLGASAIRKSAGMPQRMLIAVPHPAGGPLHLLAASIPGAGADRIRSLVKAGRKKNSMIDIKPAEILDVPVEWMPVSDEREEVTTRRDSARPVAAYAGRTVHVWGCGGLGSWIAEYLVRAGAKKIVLCDPGTISGGLLVRQNFVEMDVGNTKVDALARRLRAISDAVEVIARKAMVPGGADLSEVDLIIDATVSVAIGRFLDSLAAASDRRPMIAQVSVDTQTGTLGVMNVSMPPLKAGPLAIDRKVGAQILLNGDLEAFHCFWTASATGGEIIPTRGCSTPTFHGSAADLAGMAASLTSILGTHMNAEKGVSGTHLISLPHGEAGPKRIFLPV